MAATAATLAVPALALVGGLAVACFVKVYGIVFLGVPRAEAHVARHEAGWSMLLPMLLLGVLCVGIGLLPGVVTRSLQRVTLSLLPVTGMAEGLPLPELVPTMMITISGVVLLVLIAIFALWYRRRLAESVTGTAATWGCGYQRPAARMQYSASSFAEMLTSLFAFVLKPVNHPPQGINGLFPPKSRFLSHVPETVLELVYIPVLIRLYGRFSGFRRLQSGILQQYVLYSLITLVLLLAASYF